MTVPEYDCIERYPYYPRGGGSSVGNGYHWIIEVNNTGSDLNYCSYLGGALDNRIFQPYVDFFGDVWAMGWIDSDRDYQVGSSKYLVGGAIFPPPPPPIGSPDPRWDTAISGDAFKAYNDSASTGTLFLPKVAYGALSQQYPFSHPPIQPQYISTLVAGDGYVIRIRPNSSTIQTYGLSPGTVPGGLGATGTGTIGISDVAPSGGAVIDLSISGTGLSFSNIAVVTTETVTIPAGQQLINFTLYSSPVTTNSTCTVTANYSGDVTRQA